MHIHGSNRCSSNAKGLIHTTLAAIGGCVWCVTGGKRVTRTYPREWPERMCPTCIQTQDVYVHHHRDFQHFVACNCQVWHKSLQPNQSEDSGLLKLCRRACRPFALSDLFDGESNRQLIQNAHFQLGLVADKAQEFRVYRQISCSKRMWQSVKHDRCPYGCIEIRRPLKESWEEEEEKPNSVVDRSPYSDPHPWRENIQGFWTTELWMFLCVSSFEHTLGVSGCFLDQNTYFGFKLRVLTIY